jgi:Recombinase zinc beta ribbon domain
MADYLIIPRWQRSITWITTPSAHIAHKNWGVHTAMVSCTELASGNSRVQVPPEESLRGRDVSSPQRRRPMKNTRHFDWNGRRYVDSHQPVVSRELWERVQGVLDGRNASKSGRKTKRDFAFSGLIKCWHCGCALVGELKKKRYVYYHCTGYKGIAPNPMFGRRLSANNFPPFWGGSPLATRSCRG